ncbi:hypothetical protein BDR26DRAFT_869089 [Obelidium mucronatum]|nr:hypothetical protein BDR26DRAFT_869089 [Obelidium mucronatum]
MNTDSDATAINQRENTKTRRGSGVFDSQSSNTTLAHTSTASKEAGLDQSPLPPLPTHPGGGSGGAQNAAHPAWKKDKDKDAEKSSDSLLSGASTSTNSSRRGSLKEDNEIFISQPVLHRTGWDLYGKVEDEEDSPMRKLAGVSYWNRVVVHLKNWRTLTAKIEVSVPDSSRFGSEFGLFSHSFWLTPPPGALNETNDGKEFMWIMIAPSEDLKLQWIAAFMKAAGWREQQLTASGQVPTITVHRPETESLAWNNQSSPSTLSRESAAAPSQQSTLNSSTCDAFSTLEFSTPSSVSPGVSLSGSGSTHTSNSPSTSNAPSSLASPELSAAKSSLLQSSIIDTIFPFPIPDVTSLVPEDVVGNTSSNNTSGGKSKLESNEALKLMCASNARFFKNGGFKSASSLIKGAERRLSQESNDTAKQQQKTSSRKKSTAADGFAESGLSSGNGGGSSPKALPRRATSPTIRNFKQDQEAPQIDAPEPSASVSSSKGKKAHLPRRQTSPKLHQRQTDNDSQTTTAQRAAESMGSIH